MAGTQEIHMDLSPKIERIYHDTPLQHGQHKSGDDGRCAMEMAALLAGEKHSDQPVCASPLVTRFVICVNDRMNDDERQRLKPFIPAMIGTRDGYDRERMWFLVTQAVTVFAPLALRATGQDGLAKTLEAIGPIATVVAARAAAEICRQVRDSARAATYAADADAAADAADADAAADAAYAAAATYAAYAAADAADAAYAAASRRKTALGFREKVVSAMLSTVDRLTQIGREPIAEPPKVAASTPEMVAAE